MQGHGVRHFNEFNSSEEVLMFVVLEQSIQDVLWPQKYSLKTRETIRLQAAALRWFQTTDQDYVFSYLNICYTLEINPQNLLKRVIGAYEVMESQ